MAQGVSPLHISRSFPISSPHFLLPPPTSSSSLTSYSSPAMPRTPSFIHHRVHEHKAAPYHLDNLRVPPTTSFISSATPSPTSTLVQRSYPPSSAGTSPSPTRRDLSPFDTPAKPKHNAFAADGELYPYVKGKKVSNAQLAQLLQWFKEDENPAKDARVLMANQLQM